MDEKELNECLWQEIVARAGKRFETHKGAPFTYYIKEDRSGETSGVMMIDGKMKKLTRATILLAYHRARDLQEAHGCVSKPGKIGVYGDTWLYPVFLDIGICTRTKDEKARLLTQKWIEEREMPEQSRTEEEREMPEQSRTERLPVKICSGCGYTTSEDFDFCPKCGRKFQIEAQEKF